MLPSTNILVISIVYVHAIPILCEYIIKIIHLYEILYAQIRRGEKKIVFNFTYLFEEFGYILEKKISTCSV